jgi:hypothetical protein
MKLAGYFDLNRNAFDIQRHIGNAFRSGKDFNRRLSIDPQAYGCSDNVAVNEELAAVPAVSTPCRAEEVNRI